MPKKKERKSRRRKPRNRKSSKVQRNPGKDKSSDSDERTREHSIHMLHRRIIEQALEKED